MEEASGKSRIESANPTLNILEGFRILTDSIYLEITVPNSPRVVPWYDKKFLCFGTLKGMAAR